MTVNLVITINVVFRSLIINEDVIIVFILEKVKGHSGFVQVVVQIRTLPCAIIYLREPIGEKSVPAYNYMPKIAFK